MVFEKNPEATLDEMLLPQNAIDSCREVIEEQLRADLLRAYGLEPRNKILLTGPPGNGKTSLAEAVSEALMVPLLTVRHERLLGGSPGEAASWLDELFGYAITRKCVLLFDEFDIVAIERGAIHETGEAGPLLAPLLLRLDALPSYVVAIAATSHEQLLDKAAWRRFPTIVNLPNPSRSDLEAYFKLFEARRKHNGFAFGLDHPTLADKLLGRSFAEAEEFALSVYRQFILRQPDPKPKDITRKQLILMAKKTLRRAAEAPFGGAPGGCPAHPARNSAKEKKDRRP
jgi:SpoVK/Ycf46/Vps4 family AAA+-type ATPase